MLLRVEREKPTVCARRAAPLLLRPCSERGDRPANWRVAPADLLRVSLVRARMRSRNPSVTAHSSCCCALHVVLDARAES